MASARAASASVTVTTDSPASWMSAWGNPVKRLTASVPSASSAKARACSAWFGWSSVPWRMTWGSMGACPQAITGRTLPAIASSRISAARAAVPSMSTWG
jgi:hypothetical protein